MSDSESRSTDLLAFNQGKESGLYFGGAYSRGMNPYTSFAVGVAKHRAWREGFIAGANEKRKANSPRQVSTRSGDNLHADVGAERTA